jgi:hypothetical protein
VTAAATGAGAVIVLPVFGMALAATCFGARVERREPAVTPSNTPERIEKFQELQARLAMRRE